MAENEKKEATNERPAARGGSHWLTGLTLALLFLFCLLALTTYDWRDISWLMTPANDPKNNMIGVVGAWSVFFGYHLVGMSLWIVPVWLGFASVQVLAGHGQDLWRRTAWGVLFLAALCAVLQLGNGLFGGVLAALNMGGDAGGAIGDLLMTSSLEQWLSPVGGGILAAAVLLVSGVMAVGPARIAAAMKSLAAWRARRAEAAVQAENLQAEADRLRAEQEESKAAERGFAGGRTRLTDEPLRREAARNAEAENRNAEAEKKEAAAKAEEDRRTELKRRAEEARAAAKQAAAEAPPVAVAAVVAKPAAALSGYRLPGIELLDPIPPGDAVHGDTDQMAKLLVDTLAQFNLLVEVTHVERGPVVTRYELLPAAGIKVERIAQLANTLQMVLRANSLRIQAPVPGKNVVGVEVPNPVARKVTLREVLQGSAWASQKFEIPLALGKDVGGADMIFDLATAPHLLVAGATGSGKSVCLNAILTGLMMSRRPDELKLLLVDPKRVEFPPYNNLPHLLVPVVTDAKKVSFALRWAIVEMDRRYKILQAARVRNIAAFNAREPVKQTELALDGVPATANDGGLPAKMPYIVIVIDEVADLMITVGQEIEQSITRLAQLSRAVGIHMVLATQRPSVNVITGTIKANFPGRIAFQVAQKTDSRTILDQQGAETLIGRGDMLFLNPKNSRLLRAQGALVNDGEIVRVVEFVKGQVGPDFDQSFAAKLDKVQETVVDEEISGSGGGGNVAGGVDGDDNADEELIQQSMQVIRDTRRASTSSLQRRLRIGYTRAARVMDILEERGIVGPPRGADPREILIDLDAEMPNNDATGPASDAGDDDRTGGDERRPGV